LKIKISLYNAAQLLNIQAYNNFNSLTTVDEVILSNRFNNTFSFATLRINLPILMWFFALSDTFEIGAFLI
jgi:hypothetical protein